jgi:hypothetical protein
VLEVGMGNGARAEWFLEHILPLADSRYVGIDDFDDPRATTRTRNRLTTVRARLGKYGNKVTLTAHLDLGLAVHIVCINCGDDASAINDWSALIWPSLAVGGVMIWGGYRQPRKRIVQDAVDAFLADHDYEVIWAKSNMAVRKI